MCESRVVKTLLMGKGVTLRLILDPSHPEDSTSRWTSEGTAKGRPGDDIFSAPPHWHKHHTEYMDVREGRVQITVDGVNTIVTADDRPFTIPAGVVHSLKSFPGERVVVRESADPPGEYKHLFFADFLSVSYPPGFWHTMRVFYDGDAYPSLGLYFKAFDIAFVTILGGIAKLFVQKRREKLE